MVLLTRSLVTGGKTEISRLSTNKTKRIYEVSRGVSHQVVEVSIAAVEIQRVLRNESLEARAVVSGAVKVQSGAVVFTAGELIRVAVGGTPGRSRTEGLIRVVR